LALLVIISIAKLLKGHSQLWDGTDLDKSFLNFGKSSPQPEIKVNLKIRFNLRSVLFDFQSLTEKPVFECAFAHPMILFSVHHIWLKTVWTESLRYAN